MPTFTQRIKGFIDRVLPKKELTKEYGSSGTLIQNGYITEEFNEKLLGTDGIEIYDKMVRTDASISSLLKAYKLQIQQANWIIEPGSEKDSDKEVADFVYKNLFQDLEKPFMQLLPDFLLMLDYGVIAFEKVWEVVDDKTILGKLAYRAPRSYIKWELDNGEFGLVQYNYQTGEYAQIPKEKLLIFWNERQGDDYWGRSVLRSCYKNYKIKDDLDRFAVIANERFSIPPVVVTVPQGSSERDFDKADELGKNIRANQQSRIVKKEGWLIEILQGGNNTKNLQPDISYHDRQISKSGLAQTLEMGQETGTQALGSTMERLRSLCLESIARNIAETVNRLIKELVDLNYDNIEYYPTLEFNGITKDDISAKANSVATLIGAGAITNNYQTEAFLRETLGLPEITEEDYEKEKQAKQQAQQQAEQAKQDQLAQAQAKEAEGKATEKTPSEKEEAVDEVEEEQKEVELQATPEITLENPKEPPQPTERELQYIKDITKNENQLQDYYLKLENEAKEYELKLRDFLKSMYKKAKTYNDNGTERLSPDNVKLQAKIKKGIGLIMQDFRDKWASDEKTKELMDIAKQNAQKAWKNLFRLAPDIRKLSNDTEIEVPTGTYNSYMAGYISNLGDGLIYNSERQTYEGVIENFGSEAPLKTVLETADLVEFNKNNLYLSFTTHPRALYKDLVANKAEEVGYPYMKLVIPEGIETSPNGETMSNLFMIGTLYWWSQRRDDSVSNPVGFSMHHGSQEYFYPIAEEDLEEEEMIAEEQRRQLKKKQKLQQDPEITLGAPLGNRNAWKGGSKGGKGGGKGLRGKATGSVRGITKQSGLSKALGIPKAEASVYVIDSYGNTVGVHGTYANSTDSHYYNTGNIVDTIAKRKKKQQDFINQFRGTGARIQYDESNPDRLPYGGGYIPDPSNEIKQMANGWEDHAHFYRLPKTPENLAKYGDWNPSIDVYGKVNTHNSPAKLAEFQNYVYIDKQRQIGANILQYPTPLKPSQIQNSTERRSQLNQIMGIVKNKVKQSEYLGESYNLPNITEAMASMSTEEYNKRKNDLKGFYQNQIKSLQGNLDNFMDAKVNALMDGSPLGIKVARTYKPGKHTNNVFDPPATANVSSPPENEWHNWEDEVKDIAVLHDLMTQGYN